MATAPAGDGARIALAAALLVFALCSRNAAPGEVQGPVYRREGSPAGSTSATWAVDPQDPGPNLPASGHSLFDFLIAAEDGDTRVPQVPFPFSALLARIEERLGRRPGEASPLKPVLIPLGRSLQRNAADPEFFRYPRVVVAVDTEARQDSPGVEMLLKDRLYLGYHEKAEILEVISYNEAAGRFEFQLVLDYGRGGSARLVSANRAVCTACHQAGGPLFPRQTWDETNANPEIARRLAAEQRDFYGLPVAQGLDVPAAIDAATDRANRIAVTQLLWREGCGDSESEPAVRCRAAAFTAALQSRLSGGLHDTASARFREEFLRAARSTWRLRWPQGLAIPDPDIPNRDPLAAAHRAQVAAASLPVTLGPEESRRLGTLVLASHVPAFFEPLNPRPPLEVWTADGGDDDGPARLVAGLAELLADQDAERLDAALFDDGGLPQAPREHRAVPCELALHPRGTTGERVKLRCADAAVQPLALEGRVFVDGSRVLGGTIDRLDTGAGVLRDLDVVGGQAGGTAGRRELEIAVVQKLSRLHARRADGAAVERIRLSWNQGEATGEATVIFLADFVRAEAAVQKLAARTATNVLDLFSSRPFRRTAVVGGLFAELGLAGGTCCLDDTGMPRPVLETGDTAGPADFPEPAVRALYRYCAGCHATPEVSPPNFLYGDADRVRTSLAACAERIFFRLEVWRLPAAQRPKTPMPPVHALTGLGLTAESWASDPALQLLRQHASEMLRANTGAAPRLEDLETRGYESLRSCLPPATLTRRFNEPPARR